MRDSLREKSVLDYGCGTGRWVAFLQRQGCRYSGVDIAPEMLRIARARHPDVDLARVVEDRVPHADRTFDLVCSIAVVHHNPYDKQEKILAEMVRVLKDDGTLLLLEGLGPMRPVKSVYYPRPLQEWLALAGRCGMECYWYRGATYFLLRAAIARLTQRRPEISEVSIDPEAGTRGPYAGRWRRLVARMDAIADPYLLRALPNRYHTRAIMLLDGKSKMSVTADLTR